MTGTGYTRERDQAHRDLMVTRLIPELAALGYEPCELPPEGDDPDLKIYDWRLECEGYVDLKVSKPGQPNFAVKSGALDRFRELESHGASIFIVWVDGLGRWFVDTPSGAAARMIGGRRRATMNGSETDWYLIRHGGDPWPGPFE